jgi:hypothetical protein
MVFRSEARVRPETQPPTGAAPVPQEMATPALRNEAILKANLQTQRCAVFSRPSERPMTERKESDLHVGPTHGPAAHCNRG